MEELKKNGRTQESINEFRMRFQSASTEKGQAESMKDQGSLNRSKHLCPSQCDTEKASNGGGNHIGGGSSNPRAKPMSSRGSSGDSNVVEGKVQRVQVSFGGMRETDCCGQALRHYLPADRYAGGRSDSRRPYAPRKLGAAPSSRRADEALIGRSGSSARPGPDAAAARGGASNRVARPPQGEPPRRRLHSLRDGGAASGAEVGGHVSGRTGAEGRRREPSTAKPPDPAAVGGPAPEVGSVSSPNVCARGGRGRAAEPTPPSLRDSEADLSRAIEESLRLARPAPPVEEETSRHQRGGAVDTDGPRPAGRHEPSAAAISVLQGELTEEEALALAMEASRAAPAARRAPVAGAAGLWEATGMASASSRVEGASRRPSRGPRRQERERGAVGPRARPETNLAGSRAHAAASKQSALPRANDGNGLRSVAAAGPGVASGPHEAARQPEPPPAQAVGDRELRREQDAAYEESLARDRAKEAALQRARAEAQQAEREQTRREEEALAAEQLQAKAKDERSKRARSSLADALSRLEKGLEKEPTGDSAGDSCEVAVDYGIGGKRFVRAFPLEAPAAAIYDFVRAQVIQAALAKPESDDEELSQVERLVRKGGMQLVQNFAPRPLADNGVSLRELGFVRREKFILKQTA